MCIRALRLSKSSQCQNDLDYMDDNAERLGRQKMRSDAMKRQFAIQGTLDALYYLMRPNLNFRL